MSSASGRIDVVAVSGGRLWQYWYDGSWHGWQSQGLGPGGTSYRSPAAAVAWGSRRLDVFTVDQRTGGLLMRYFDGSWHGPVRVDFAGPPG